MATPNEKLAASLEALRHLQVDGARVFTSNQLTRTERARLLKHGFLQEVMKGWLISANPAARAGDTTPWFASFWEFCRRYCEERFARAWHLSPEQSLLLHAENTVIPKQVIIYSPAANNNRIDLLFETSLFALKQKAMPATRDLEIHHGVRVYRAEAALTRVPASFFSQHPVEAQVVLGGIRDPSELLSRLLEGGHAVIAGRLAGVFRRLSQAAIADEIVAEGNLRGIDHLIAWDANLTDDGATALAESDDAASVTHLDLSWNHVGAGAGALVGSPKLARLVRLRLYHNDIGAAGAARIAASSSRC